MLGYFGRINYNYKQRYLLSVNARYDASSMLGREHKWGFFPGASIGWNVHEEAFWKDMNADAFRLKLRGSYGVMVILPAWDRIRRRANTLLAREGICG